MQDRDQEDCWPEEPNNLRSDPAVCNVFQYSCFEPDDLNHIAKKSISTGSLGLNDSSFGANRKAQSIQLSPLQLYLQGLQDAYIDRDAETHRDTKRLNLVNRGDEKHRNDIDHTARRLHAERSIQLARRRQKQELLDKIRRPSSKRLDERNYTTYRSCWRV